MCTVKFRRCMTIDHHSACLVLYPHRPKQPSKTKRTFIFHQLLTRRGDKSWTSAWRVSRWTLRRAQSMLSAENIMVQQPPAILTPIRAPLLEYSVGRVLIKYVLDVVLFPLPFTLVFIWRVCMFSFLQSQGLASTAAHPKTLAKRSRVRILHFASFVLDGMTAAILL